MTHNQSHSRASQAYITYLLIYFQEPMIGKDITPGN